MNIKNTLYQAKADHQHVQSQRAQENYIKTIFQLGASQRHETRAATNKAKPLDPAVHPLQLSEKLAVNVSAVYLMLKKLEQQKRIIYQPYKGVVLTAQGKKLALQLLRRHRLWESFLQSKLGFDWSEVHTLAEELEHIGNEELIKRLEQFLNFPTADPHGDPIPDSEGRLRTSTAGYIKLSELAIGEKGVLKRLLEANEEFFGYLKEIELTLGTVVIMDGQSTFDASYRITVGGQKHIYLSKKAADLLFVEKTF